MGSLGSTETGNVTYAMASKARRKKNIEKNLPPSAALSGTHKSSNFLKFSSYFHYFKLSHMLTHKPIRLREKECHTARHISASSGSLIYEWRMDIVNKERRVLSDSIMLLPCYAFYIKD